MGTHGGGGGGSSSPPPAAEEEMPPLTPWMLFRESIGLSGSRAWWGREEEEEDEEDEAALERALDSTCLVWAASAETAETEGRSGVKKIN